MADPDRSIVILGIGNLVRRDDGVGLHVVRRLRSAGLPEACALKENPGQWFSVLEQIAGFDQAVLIDAADLGRPPGTILELSLSDADRSCAPPSFTMHGGGLRDALRIGKELGLALPSEVKILAIQVADAESFSESCSPEVDRAIGEACTLVHRWVTGVSED